MYVMRNSFSMLSPLHNAFRTTTTSHQLNDTNREVQTSEQIAKASSIKKDKFHHSCSLQFVADVTNEHHEPEELPNELLDASPSLQILEPGGRANDRDGQLPSSPSPQSLPSNENQLEQAVCESPFVSLELPLDDHFISASPLPCHKHGGQTDRDVHSSIEGLSDVPVCDMSVSDCRFHLSDIKTPCYVPETPIVSRNSEKHFNTGADKELEEATNSKPWDSLQDNQDCHNGSYSDCEEVYYDWISSDSVPENAGQNSHRQSSVLFDVQHCSTPDSSHPIKQVIPHGDLNKASCTHNPFGESLEDFLVVSADTENFAARFNDQISMKTKPFITASSVVDLCNNGIEISDETAVRQIPPQHIDPIEVDMCDDEDELFARCLPEEDILAKAGLIDSQQCDVGNQHPVTPCNPKHPKTKRVTPMPDYDNMATPILKVISTLKRSSKPMNILYVVF